MSNPQIPNDNDAPSGRPLVIRAWDLIRHSGFGFRRSPRMSIGSRSVPRRAVILALSALLFSASGANCPGFLRDFRSANTRVLPPTPTLAQVMQVVNDNSAKVTSGYTTEASISVPMMPALHANIAWERPRKFRLRAETALTGPEVDLGSNPELFWFWVRRTQRDEPKAVYFCSHANFANSPARRMLPVEPEWLIEALGVVTFDPAGQHRGPIPVGTGRLQIQTSLTTASGPMTKVTVVDELRGLVLEQHLYDAQGQRIATALTSQHQADPVSGAILPRHIEIQWPATQFSLKIDLRSLQVNNLAGDPQQLWSLPDYPGWPPYDLGQAGVPMMQLQPAMGQR